MTKRKPSWSLWLTWIAIYTAMDILFQKFYAHHLTWSTAFRSLNESTVPATFTWLFALLRWHRKDSAT